jgi:pimeloyl-ACP methyl ester carboxylesterase
VERITLESYRVAGIPVLVMAPEGCSACPVVFYVHGFTGDKREGLPLGYRLASNGIVCIAVDAARHGDRLDERVAHLEGTHPGDLYPPESGLDNYLLMNQVVVETARDIGRLIEHFAPDPRLDIARLGVTGVSMGGYTTFYLAATDPRVQVAASIVGIPAFAERWEDVTLEATSYPQWAAIMAERAADTARWTGFMREIDPFDRLRSFAPHPLLMICGDKDIDAPKIYCVKLYRLLQPAYATQPQQLRLLIDDNADHRVRSGMWDAAAAWFARWLATGG